MPSFYPENNTAKPSDDAMRSLHKLVDGGGGGGGASAGNGAPTGATTGNLYVDELNRDIYVKIGGVWEIALDLV